MLSKYCLFSSQFSMQYWTSSVHYSFVYCAKQDLFNKI